SVEVTGRRKTITLKPNHRAICTDSEIEMEEFDAGKAIAWTEPVSTLSNPSGPDIERTFLKCYGIKLSISKSGRRNYLTLAMDRRESPEEFLQRCKDMYPDLEYYYQDGAYYLK
ncbi:MAG TPA: hypothetical protein VJ720_14770, partial [Chitinophaga sp.]|nr:hypothetical protein [Chitinophaga sp.]